ncbi:MAG: hypothetical protein ACREA2_10925, partial [Blastocatellia bacterium]
VQKRVSELIEREKTTGLSAEETAELNDYLSLEYLGRLAKARLRRGSADGNQPPLISTPEELAAR